MDTRQTHLNERSYQSRNDVDDIEHDIEQTRSEMDETLNELGEKLNPKNLIDHVFDLFRSNSQSAAQSVGETVKSSGQNITGQIRENPVPALLIGAGVAWLIYDNATDDDSENSDDRRHARRERQSYYGNPRHQARDYPNGRRAGQQRNYGNESANGIRSNVTANSGANQSGKQFQDSDMSESNVASKVKSAAGKVGSTMEQSAENTWEGAKDMGEQAAAGIQHAGEKAWEGVEYAGEKMYEGASYVGSASMDAIGSATEGVKKAAVETWDWLEEAAEKYPVAIGIGCAALGVLVGLAIPRTRREDRLMGETADNLKEQAMETGKDLLEKGEEVASQTASKVMDAAESEGLDPDTIAKKTSQKVGAVKDAAIEAMEDAGVDSESFKKKTEGITSEVGKKKDNKDSKDSKDKKDLDKK